MVTPARELDGQVALVTGGALNIGRAICLDLAHGGAAVCINAHRSEQAANELAADIQAAGGRAMVHMADVTDEAAVDAMMAAVISQLGGLNILINNASFRALAPLADMDLATWRQAQSVTVEGSFLCARAAIPLIMAAAAGAGTGSIINIGGVAAYIGVKDRLHAATAKGL